MIWLDERMIKALKGFQREQITHAELQKVYSELKLEKDVKKMKKIFITNAISEIL